VSDDPQTIDVALARRLVDSQFPQWSSLPIAPVEFEGWDNRTFRLGSELTVRLKPGSGFPYPWSVYRWIDGELASNGRCDSARPRPHPASARDAAAPSVVTRVPGQSRRVKNSSAQRVFAC
jgi:hypothetical protein